MLQVLVPQQRLTISFSVIAKTIEPFTIKPYFADFHCLLITQRKIRNYFCENLYAYRLYYIRKFPTFTIQKPSITLLYDGLGAPNPSAKIRNFRNTQELWRKNPCKILKLQQKNLLFFSKTAKSRPEKCIFAAKSRPEKCVLLDESRPKKCIINM